MPPKNAKKPKKAANGYKLPDPLPEGLIISNVHTKKSWRIGKSIGVGGFGEIYLCHEDKNKAVGDDAPFAVKIEPHENGPLFVEMNFYIRAAKPEMVESFVKAHKLQHLGMPVLRGNGSHTHKSKSYRFLVMDRFGKDLEKVFQNGKNVFSLKTSFNLAIKTLDVLEYIHSQGYVHNDIKAQNLLLGYGRAKENNVFLVDFGLVCKYQRGEIHLEYKPDARKAHDGTIEYTSRDAHIGTHSRRSDLEILGYNLIHWMSGNLPWMDNLSSPQYDELKKFMGYTASLEFDTCPDYDKCRDIFKGGLKKRGYPLDGKIDFLPSQSPGKKARKSRSKRCVDKFSVNLKPDAAPCNETESGASTRSGKANKWNDWSWEQVLLSDPEMLIRQASRHSHTESKKETPLALEHRLLEEKKQKESLRNPTPAMKTAIKNMKSRENEGLGMTWQQQLQLVKRKKNSRANHLDLKPNPLTPAMEEVIKMRSNRISLYYEVPKTLNSSDCGQSEKAEHFGSWHEEYTPSTYRKHKSISQPQLNGRCSIPARSSLREDDVINGSNRFKSPTLASGSKDKPLSEITSNLRNKTKSDKLIVNKNFDLTSTLPKQSNSSRKGSKNHKNRVDGNTYQSLTKTYSKSVKSSNGVPNKELGKEYQLIGTGARRNSLEYDDLGRSKVRKKSLRRVHEEIALEDKKMRHEQDENIEHCKEAMIKPSSTSAPVVTIVKKRTVLQKSKGL